MTNAQKLLRETVNSDLNINPETWQDSVFEKDVLSAMEEQSIKFAEWCEHNYTKMSNGLWAGNFTYNEHGEYTIKQLYKLFNEL